MLGTLLVGIGCAPPPPGWVDPTADDDWSALVPADEHAPAWDAAAFAERFDAAFAAGVPLPQPVLAAYRELLGHGDATCPGTTFEDGFLVMGSCTTAEGYTYSGAAGLQTEDLREGDPEGDWTGTATVTSAPADYVITRPDGTRLLVGGNLAVSVARSTDNQEWSARIAGTVQDEAAAGWLGDGYSGNLDVVGHLDPHGSWQWLHGSFTTLGVTLDLVQLEVRPEACADGFFRGTVRMRQTDATWYEMVLPEGCARCGPLTWEGDTALGEACLDPAPLFASMAEAACF